MLADVIWCNDKSIGSVTGLGYGTGSEEYYKTGYSGYKRSSTGAPSLECPEASGSDKKLSKFTAKDTIYGNGTLKIHWHFIIKPMSCLLKADSCLLFLAFVTYISINLLHRCQG